jgi:S1-C subfamily serine protease
MPIRVTCPHCRKEIKATDDYAGKIAACPGCGGAVNIPASGVSPRPPIARQAVRSPSRKHWLAVATGGGLAIGVAMGAVFGYKWSRPTPPITSTPATADVFKKIPDESKPSLRLASEPTSPTASSGPIIGDSKLDREKIADLLSRSVATVRVELSDGTGIGSGFFVQDDRTLVTSLHVVRGALTIQVDTRSRKSLPCNRFIAISEQYDLAVLRVGEKSAGAVLQLSAAPPKQGADVFTYGSPRDLEGTFSTGVVSALRADLSSLGLATTSELGEAKRIQFTAAISPGNSGGPLVDAQGKVVGIVESKIGSVEAGNFAIDAGHLLELLDGVAPGWSQPIAKLPSRHAVIPAVTPVDVIAAELSKATEAADRRSQELRDSIRDSARAHKEVEEKVSKSADRRARLAALDGLIREGNLALQRVESEGTGLTAQHGQVQAEGAAIFQSGQSINAQIDSVRFSIAGLENEIIARANAQGNSGDPRGPGALEADLYRLRTQRDQLLNEARHLELRYLQLVRQAQSLQGQIRYKLDERQHIQIQLGELLREQAELAASLER